MKSPLLASISLLILAPLLVIGAITPGAVPNARDLGIAQGSPVSDVPGLVGILAQIVTWIYRIFFILAVALILFAAFNYLTAADDADRVGTAKKQIIYAAIAIVIAFLSVGFEVIIKNFLENPAATSSPAPSNTYYEQYELNRSLRGDQGGGNQGGTTCAPGDITCEVNKTPIPLH